MHDGTAPHPDPSTPERESLARRRKRALVVRAAKGLKRRLTTYRAIAVAAVVALVALGAYTVIGNGPAERDAPDAVVLGTGKAGVDVSAANAATPGPSPTTPDAAPDAAPDVSGEHVGDGQASFYGDELAGNPTASGERFDPAKLTAAHRTLPLGSRVRVTNLRNGESVVVRINDRGPFHDRRVIDLSKAAARQIGMLQRGTARVRIELLNRL
jgi:hypothetical protein